MLREFFLFLSTAHYLVHLAVLALPFVIAVYVGYLLCRSGKKLPGLKPGAVKTVYKTEPATVQAKTFSAGGLSPEAAAVAKGVMDAQKKAASLKEEAAEKDASVAAIADAAKKLEA